MMFDQVRIEPARRDDEEAMLRLLREASLPGDDLVNHLATAIVARLDGLIIGSAALEIYDDGALLRSIAVAPEARRSGIGERLVRAALARADRLGAQTVFLLTTTAADYFPRFGFEVIERGTVPPGVRQSVEFRSACPATATAMRRFSRSR